MNIIGVDPSGSFNEGSGTTGIVVISGAPELIYHEAIEAKWFDTRFQYWEAIIAKVQQLAIRFDPAVVSIEDYVLYATSAKAQINSEMETSKLIGALNFILFCNNTPQYMRNAGLVKARWANPILIEEGIIQKQGNTYADLQGKPINHHCMDALRHAVHCHFFEVSNRKGKQLT